MQCHNFIFCVQMWALAQGKSMFLPPPDATATMAGLVYMNVLDHELEKLSSLLFCSFTSNPFMTTAPPRNLHHFKCKYKTVAVSHLLLL